MNIANIGILLVLVKRHNERYVLNVKFVMFAKDINQSFTYIAIDTALDRVVNRRNTSLDFKENIEEPF